MYYPMRSGRVQVVSVKIITADTDDLTFLARSLVSELTPATCTRSGTTGPSRLFMPNAKEHSVLPIMTFWDRLG